MYACMSKIFPSTIVVHEISSKRNDVNVKSKILFKHIPYFNILNNNSLNNIQISKIISSASSIIQLLRTFLDKIML